MNATVKIDIVEYIDGLRENPGYVDGSLSFYESDDKIVMAYDTLEEAEAEIDNTVYLRITNNEAIIEYEYIAGEENVYFNNVEFMGKKYGIDCVMFSKECYDAIIKELKL